MSLENKKEQEEMSEAAKKARREYMREYRKNNKERIKAIEKRYWEKRSKRRWGIE